MVDMALLYHGAILILVWECNRLTASQTLRFYLPLYSIDGSLILFLCLIDVGGLMNGQHVSYHINELRVFYCAVYHAVIVILRLMRET